MTGSREALSGRRWTLYGITSDVKVNGEPGTFTRWEAYPGSPNEGDEEGIEVMPVNEDAMSDAHWLKVQDKRVAEAEQLLADAEVLLLATANCSIPPERRIRELTDRIADFLPSGEAPGPSVAETCLSDRDLHPGDYA